MLLAPSPVPSVSHLVSHSSRNATHPTEVCLPHPSAPFCLSKLDPRTSEGAGARKLDLHHAHSCPGRLLATPGPTLSYWVLPTLVLPLGRVGKQNLRPIALTTAAVRNRMFRELRGWEAAADATLFHHITARFPHLHCPWLFSLLCFRNILHSLCDESLVLQRTRTNKRPPKASPPPGMHL